GVSEGDRATMDIDALRIDPELSEHRDRLRRKGFVHFEQIDVVQIPSDLLRHTPYGFDRSHQHKPWRESARRLTDDSRHRRKTKRLRALRPHHHERGRAVADAGSVARG